MPAAACTSPRTARCPRWLGMRAVVVKQFARIDVANLEGGEFVMAAGGNRIVLKPAFGKKDIPTLKGGGALSEFKGNYKG